MDLGNHGTRAFRTVGADGTEKGMVLIEQGVIEGREYLDKMKESFFVLNKQLTESLAKLGLEQIKSVGEKFDPNLHEAIMQTQTEEYPEETVIQEFQKGYKLGDKVLRPARVAVAVK